MGPPAQFYLINIQARMDGAFFSPIGLNAHVVKFMTHEYIMNQIKMAVHVAAKRCRGHDVFPHSDNDIFRWKHVYN